jgi:hypothetical protein
MIITAHIPIKDWSVFNPEFPIKREGGQVKMLFKI